MAFRNPVGFDIKNYDITQKSIIIKLSIFAQIYQFLGIAILTFVFVMPLKMLFDRDRPSRILKVYRYCNMRDLEHGKSMPSGDAAAAAFFCGTYFYLFNFHWLTFIVVPLVCFGRVYVHCHWFGDTIIGAFMGHLFALICYRKESYSILAWPIF